MLICDKNYCSGLSYLSGAAAWGLRMLPLERRLFLCKRLGFNALELGIANGLTDLPLSASDADARHVCAAYDQSGIKLYCAATGSDFTLSDKKDAATQVDNTIAALRLCGAMGISVLRIFAGFTKLEEMTQEKWDVLLNSLRRVGQEAQRLGVTPGIETHGAVVSSSGGVKHLRSVTTQVDTLRRVLDAAGGKARVVFDPANLNAVGETDVIGFLQAIKGQVCYAHLKDFSRDEDGTLHPVALGEGPLDWTAPLAALRNANIPVFFEYERCEDVAYGMEKCRDFWNLQKTEMR